MMLTRAEMLRIARRAGKPEYLALASCMCRECETVIECAHVSLAEMFAFLEIVEARGWKIGKDNYWHCPEHAR